MELKEFIRNSLTQIADGVQAAINDSKDKGYLINPSVAKVGTTYTVHFDLAVESAKEGKADIKILNGGLSEKNVNRLSFDVNMTFPTSGTSRKPIRPVCDNS